MEMGEIILLIGNIAQGIREIKELSDKIPPSILPPSRNTLNDLRSRIDGVENCIATLTERLNFTFPELSRLIRVYSRAISDVRIAGALADKTAEIYGIVPELTRFNVIFTNQIQEAYRRVSSGIEDLPVLDVRERGSLETKLNTIRDLIRDMQSYPQDDAQGVKRILDNISTQYSDAEAILAGLLNRILSSLDPRRQSE